MIKKYLLNSIVKFIEHTVIIYMWKRNKKIDKRLRINIVESSSCISETNTTLEINYISIEIKKITVKKKKSAAWRSGQQHVTAPWRAGLLGV